MDDQKTLSTIEQVKAISDPYKFRILKAFHDISEPATVKQIADSLDEVPAKVHYHVKKMEKLEILKLIYTKEINGIIAKYYEPTAKHFEIKCDDNLDENSKVAMLGETQRMIGKLYNNSKEIFLKEVNEASKNDEKSTGTLSMSDIYLTEEEAKEFSNYIVEFLRKHKTKNKTETDENKYHFFMSFVKINIDVNKPTPKVEFEIS